MCYPELRLCRCGGSSIVWRGGGASHARLGEVWDKRWWHKSVCEIVPSCCWKADPGWGREELQNSGSGRNSDILWEWGQLQVPARNLKLSSELCCLLPCQVKNSLFASLAHQFLPWCCCCVHAVLFSCSLAPTLRRQSFALLQDPLSSAANP